MGLVVPQTVKVRINKRTCKYYREKGYEFEKCGDFIEIDVFDLPKGSNEMVKIICDVCGKEAKIYYRVFIENRKKGILVSCGSDSCKHKKREDTCTKRYGVKNVAQSQKIQNKMKATNLERYGCENAMQNEKIKNKIKETNLERYGVDNPSKSQEIKNKQKKTWQENYGENITSPFQLESVKEKSKQTLLKNYGTDNPFRSKEIQNKIKTTNLERYGCTCSLQSEEAKNKSKETMLKNYGVEHALQNKEILNKFYLTNLERYGSKSYLSSDDFKNKTRDTWSFNGHEGPCSRQQKYIANLINGEINIVIAGYWADIILKNEKINLEYDGGGHRANCDFYHKITSKEFDLKEKIREDKIINNGYRMIRFIATKDRIPSDEVILNLIEGFKNSDFKVIRINFEEGTIDRDYEERWYCNFGELRKITQKDLEQFEK